MKMADFIRRNRRAIDAQIRAEGYDIPPADDTEREDWINNVEALYLWARGEGVKV